MWDAHPLNCKQIVDSMNFNNKTREEILFFRVFYHCRSRKSEKCFSKGRKKLDFVLVFVYIAIKTVIILLKNLRFDNEKTLAKRGAI